MNEALKTVKGKSVSITRDSRGVPEWLVQLQMLNYSIATTAFLEKSVPVELL
jgi:hypothetical protein